MGGGHRSMMWSQTRSNKHKDGGGGSGAAFSCWRGMVSSWIWEEEREERGENGRRSGRKKC